jgi:hypothetical protein
VDRLAKQGLQNRKKHLRFVKGKGAVRHCFYSSVLSASTQYLVLSSRFPV